MSPDEAEEYTSALGQVFSGGWRLIHSAVRLGAPAALGMTTEAWVRERLGGYVRLSIEERREAVAQLAEEGLSQREIAAVVGVDEKTVRNDRAASADYSAPDERTTASEAASVHADADYSAPRDFDAVDAATGEIVPFGEALAEIAESQADDQSNAAVGAVLRAIEEEPDVVRARLRRMFSQGVAEMSSNVLVLDPEAVAEAIQPGRLPELRHFHEAVTRWFEAFERATGRGVRAVK